MKLTDEICKNLRTRQKSYKVFDGGGLYIEVMPNGSKYFRLKYRYGKKENRLAFGVYPEVSLKEARKKRETARSILFQGFDPSEFKKKEKLKRFIFTKNTFEDIAREWHESKRLNWTPRHASYVLRRLETDVFPAIGFKPIYFITPLELLAVIRAIEKRGAIDIAHRALQTSGQIFRYAIATGRAERDISADLRGALKSRKKS